MSEIFGWSFNWCEECEECGVEFWFKVTSRDGYRKYCGRPCWLKNHNTPERNAKVGRESAAKISSTRLARSTSKWYRKVRGRHEHRTVMEKHLGRKLGPNEIVHHDDEDKRNNDLSNLILTTRPEHARHHFSKGGTL